MERFEALYERYVDGTLDAAEREEFLRLLEDPVLRRRLVQLQSFEVFVSEELRLAPVQLKDTAKSASSRTLPKVRARIPAGAHRLAPAPSRAPWIVAGAVAAGFLLLLGVALTRPEPLPRAPAPMVRETVPPKPERAPMPAPPEAPAPRPDRGAAREEREPEPLVVPPAKPTPAPVVAEAPRRPVEAPVAPPKPEAPVPPAPRESVAFVARIEAVAGEVLLAGTRITGAQGLASGQRLETGRDGYASVRFEDGTRLELGPETLLSRLGEGAAGKFVQVDQGLVVADVGRQAPGRPFAVSSGHAEAVVLGTQFSFKAATAYSRIDVKEGRVKVTRLPQAVSSVVVAGGQYVVVGAGQEFAVRGQPSGWKAPGAGLALWLRSDAGVRVSGESVTAWQDQSPAGLALAPAGQPAWVASGHQGRPAVRFDGANDAIPLPDGFADLRAGLSAYVVVKPQRGGGAVRFLDLDEGPQCDTLVFGGRDSADKLSFWCYANSTTRGKVEVPGAIVPDQLQTFGAVLYPGGRVVLTKNAAVVATGQTTMPANVVRKPNQVGRASTGDAAFKGELYEMIVYTRALNDAERAYVEGYLLAKYADATAPGPILRPSGR